MRMAEVSFNTCAALFVCFVAACPFFLSVFVFCISEVFIIIVPLPLVRACEAKLSKVVADEKIQSLDTESGLDT